ncbi:aminotransferase-like domain-containing protein [Williamsia sterculiae]|uniref:aminotransferase-like domain-containing protein n=1 Tax=Williamsia sterculiae TaxID=1344003 RepID=UPI000970F2B1|nr:PLP-dependent aminotransferase family protein [Williamsia sterculiae]
MSDDSSARIASHLRSLVATAPPGTRLPSTRSLATDFGAGPVTVQRAVTQVVAEGLIETRPGLGTFVRTRDAVAAPVDVGWQTTALGPWRASGVRIGTTLRQVTPDTIALHGGYPGPDLMPMREVRAAVSRAAKNADAFVRPPVAGVPELRQWFVTDLGADGWFDADTLITSGGQAALSATFRALAAAGDTIVMESPTYWGAIAAARQAGLVIAPITRTDGAPAAVDLDHTLAATGARLVYVQPNFANPTGDVWSTRQRTEVLEVATAHGAFVVEDDWAHDLGIDSHPLPLAAADSGGHVVYIRSLTKSLSLTLRVAAVLARGPARRRIEEALAVSDLYVSPLLQTATLDVVSRPGWRTHLQRLQRDLRIRRDALLAALAAEAPMIRVTATPPGGLNLWAQLPERHPDGRMTDPDVVTAQALAAGVSISAGSEWFPAEPTGPHIRLNFGAAGPDRYPEAARTLAEVLAR